MPRKTNRESYTISQLAAMLEISPSAIRYYEEKGLLSPERTPGNQRVYNRKNKARLKLILRGKRFGLTLAEIAEVIGMADAEVDEMAQIERSLGFVREKFAEIGERRRELDILENDLTEIKDHLERRARELSKSRCPN